MAIYREPLPDNCPPPAAWEIDETCAVYRFVAAETPTEADFRSQRAKLPEARFRVTECQARGLSVFLNPDDAKSLAQRNGLTGVRLCQVTLGKGAGRILKTGRASHYTWWPLAAFDILANCEVMG